MNKGIFKMAKVAIPALLILLSGCLKTHDGFIDLTQTTDFVILTGAGLGNFKASNLQVNTASPDTLRKTVTVDLASKDNSNGAVTVTLGVDNTVIAPYNSANGTNFQPFPAGSFKIINTSVTIPAAQHYATTTVEIYQNKLDPSVSYMLPVAITDGGGKSLSSNQNVIYYNVIGNPLAGNYVHNYYRWNGTTDTTSPPNSTVGVNDPEVVGPLTATSVTLPEYYLETFVGVGTRLSFTNTSGVLSNPVLDIDPTSQAAIDAGGFSIVTLKLVSYVMAGNAANHYAGTTFRTYLVVLNSAGSTRTLIDNYVKK